MCFSSDSKELKLINHGTSMNPLARFLVGLPFALPWLFLSTSLDIMLEPILHKLDRDYPQHVARQAWKILGV